jgi:uncharacterized protein
LIIDFIAVTLQQHLAFHMFIARLIILMLVVIVLLWLLKRLFSGEPEDEKAESAPPENMRQCKYCGVHVPESTIVMVDNEPYCCQEHVDLDQQ